MMRTMRRKGSRWLGPLITRELGSGFYLFSRSSECSSSCAASELRKPPPAKVLRHFCMTSGLYRVTSVRICRSSGGSALSAKTSLLISAHVLPCILNVSAISARSRFSRLVWINRAAGRPEQTERSAEFLFIAAQEPNEPVGHIVRDVVRRWRIRVPVLFANESLNGVGQAFEPRVPRHDTSARYFRKVATRQAGAVPVFRELPYPRR